jgi:hypothetical protein
MNHVNCLSKTEGIQFVNLTYMKIILNTFSNKNKNKSFPIYKESMLHSLIIFVPKSLYWTALLHIGKIKLKLPMYK